MQFFLFDVLNSATIAINVAAMGVDGKFDYLEYEMNHIKTQN